MGELALCPSPVPGVKVVVGQFVQPVYASNPGQAILPDMAGKKNFFLAAAAVDGRYALGGVASVHLATALSSVAIATVFTNSLDYATRSAAFDSATGTITLNNSTFSAGVTYRYIAW